MTDLRQVDPPTMQERAEFIRLAQLAVAKRWARPTDLAEDLLGPRIWLLYWRAKEASEANRGRRINANWARWEGWPTP